MNPELTMCGCRCDLCKAYAPNVQEKDQRKKLAELWHKYYGLAPSVMGVCEGCRKKPTDEGCPVRVCVLAKGLAHCGDCGDFPCNTFAQRCGSFSEEDKKDFDRAEYDEFILAYDNETRLREYRAQQRQAVSEETMRFMQGKYVLDEVSNGKDELKFRRGGKTILTIYIREKHFDFLVIFGKAEREKFEAQRGEFPQKIQEIYDNSKTYHDGKWMMIPVRDLQTLEAVKQLILIKKKPNRKPFPKEQAVYSRCGMRCDLCIHYTGGTVSEEFRAELKERFTRVYGGVYCEEGSTEMMLCPGGTVKDCGDCKELTCAKQKGFTACTDCADFPCGVCGIVRSEIAARSMAADDVTGAILPYVDGQYGN